MRKQLIQYITARYGRKAGFVATVLWVAVIELLSYGAVFLIFAVPVALWGGGIIYWQRLAEVHYNAKYELGFWVATVMGILWGTSPLWIWGLWGFGKWVYNTAESQFKEDAPPRKKKEALDE